jgi:hypothetical protein
MSKTRLQFAAAVLAAMVISFSAHAQHGRPAGAGAGAAGSMGTPSGMSAGHADMGMSTASMGHASIGGQSAGTALSNPKLDSALTSALGHSGITVPGGNLQSACGAFKNLGQCIAAMHVSKNLGIPFSELEGKMTGSGSESLGKAIQDLGGANVNAKAEAKKGTKQANADLDAAGSASGS